MACGAFSFSNAFSYPGFTLRTAINEICQSAVSRVEMRSVYNLCSTMQEVAYEQESTLIAGLFGKWRKILDAPCCQNKLWVFFNKKGALI